MGPYMHTEKVRVVLFNKFLAQKRLNVVIFQINTTNFNRKRVLPYIHLGRSKTATKAIFIVYHVDLIGQQ
jgi:hypothetical protein